MIGKIDKEICVFLALLFIASIGPAALNASENITVVGGEIENISDDSLVIDSTRYYVKDVPVLKTTGETVSKEYLKAGDTVEIFFVNKKINSVLIYENGQE